MEYSNESLIKPIANKELQQLISIFIKKNNSQKDLKKGANETTRSIKRNLCCLVILAADAEPLEIIMHIPILCEEKQIPYVFFSSKIELGRVCGLSRSVVACSMQLNDKAINNKEFNKIKEVLSNI